uniref:Uncharacterized protein n=1 Tax=Cucumis melo TaxID=3656 RepID=A0A9I9EHH6_CUCME
MEHFREWKKENTSSSSSVLRAKLRECWRKDHKGFTASHRRKRWLIRCAAFTVVGAGGKEVRRYGLHSFEEELCIAQSHGSQGRIGLYLGLRSRISEYILSSPSLLGKLQWRKPYELQFLLTNNECALNICQAVASDSVSSGKKNNCLVGIWREERGQSIFALYPGVVTP